MKISIQNLTKYFGPTSAVSDLSFALDEGESLTISGQNGAGKTTLLRMLAGLLRPDEGVIQFNAVDIYRAPLASRLPLLRRIGAVLPETFFYRDLSIAENLELYAGLAPGMSEAQNPAQLAERFGITRHLKKPIRDLSQGLVRRAAIVRALMSFPEVVLLDEPFAHLDESSTTELRGELDSRSKNGVTIIATVHNAESIVAGSRICTLQEQQPFAEVGHGR